MGGACPSEGPANGHKGYENVRVPELSLSPSYAWRMTKYNGVERSRITVNTDMSVSGVAEGGATVEDAGILHVFGVISGPLAVEGGGYASVSGVASGTIVLEAGGIIDVTGVLQGSVLTNNGELRAAVGSVIHGRTVTTTGDLVDMVGGSVVITPETRRFRLIDTGTYLSVSTPE
jgi:hypothetical protein